MLLFSARNLRAQAPTKRESLSTEYVFIIGPRRLDLEKKEIFVRPQLTARIRTASTATMSVGFKTFQDCSEILNLLFFNKLQLCIEKH
jgi:hypothetical protein